MDQYQRGGLTFDVLDSGPADGVPVVLLHGWPQFNTSWDGVADRLVAHGYRCLAPNQRGYSPRARPMRRRDYTSDELVADVVALLDAAGLPKVHLVGHDWGAAVAWGVAAQAPDRLATLTALSVPHPAAFLKAIPTSRQGLSSWYIYAFQFPKIPEKILSRPGDRGLAGMLQRLTGQSAAAARRDAERLTADPSLLTASLNWYRAMPLTDVRKVGGKITVPTMYVWSDGDTALREKGARDTARYVAGEYRFEVLAGLTHWLPDESPDTVADLLLDWFATHPL